MNSVNILPKAAFLLWLAKFLPHCMLPSGQFCGFFCKIDRLCIFSNQPKNRYFIEEKITAVHCLTQLLVP